MKRKNKLHYRNIKSTVYYTIRGIILLPIRLVLLPFKLIGGAVFYRKPKQILTLAGLRSINRRIFKNSDTISYLKKQLAHIETNLMYDATPDELNKRIILIESDISSIKKELDKKHEAITFCLKENKKDINELQLSLESMKPKDLGDIKAEALGMQIAKEEKEQSRDEKYDWHREQKAKDKQIQDRMRKDEEFEANLSKNDKIRLRNMSSFTDVSKFDLNPEDD